MRFFFVLFEFQFEFEGFGRKCNGMHRINGRKCNGMHRTNFGKRILAIVIKSLFGHCGKVAKSESPVALNLKCSVVPRKSTTKNFDCIF